MESPRSMFRITAPDPAESGSPLRPDAALVAHVNACATSHPTTWRFHMGMTGKFNRFLVAAIAALAVFPAAALAQLGTTISGQVTGPGGAPVVGASVSIPTLRVGGFTDDGGRF